MSLLLLALTVLVTAAAVLLVVNLGVVERRLRRRPARLYALEDADFRRAMGVLLGPSILPGNTVTTLSNGDAIFAAMLAAIDKAAKSICFETYIYWSGEIGESFALALKRATARGVAVHVVIDWMGSRQLDPSLQQQLLAAGIQLHRYHRLSWYHLGRLNHRTHRKLLVVDGCIGFTGGVGIAPQWTGNAQDVNHWRDLHYEVRGPVVAQMQAVFLDNWIRSTGRVLHGPAYFPALEAQGDMDAQMFGSSPQGGADSMQLMILMAITAARQSIDIANPYFIPDRMTRDALVAAVRRGVVVRVLLPGRYTDMPVARHASQGRLGRLLRAGVQVFEYQPTMLHCKLMVVDMQWVTVGSANFDNRSFRLNDEANLNVFSVPMAAEQTRLFESDLSQSTRLTWQSWRRRSLWLRTREAVSLLFEEQL
jgi:cardiolipin synthase